MTVKRNSNPLSHINRFRETNDCQLETIET